MNPSGVKKAVKRAIQANRAVFVWGPPGVGKSDVIASVAKELDMGLIDLRVILLDPVDLRGLPTVDQTTKMTSWAVPDFLPTVERDGERGILFMDELTSAPPSVQAACYQLVLDRKLGDYELPPGWNIVAAGNRQEDGAVVTRMSTALGSRFIHIDFDVDPEEWFKWANENQVKTEVTSFIRFKTTMLHDFDKNQRTFPCPRTWKFVSDIIDNLDEDIQLDMITGTVGEGPAAEFEAFIRMYRDLPDPDVILKNPKKAKIPEEPSTLYALCGSISTRANEENFDSVVEFADRIPPEYQAILIKDSVSRNNKLVNTKAFNSWVTKNATVLQ